MFMHRLGCSYSGFDPIEDTERSASKRGGLSAVLGYSGFDPIEDTESRCSTKPESIEYELQWVRSDRGY